MELRKSRRYRLQAPAFFWWDRSDGVLQEDKGTIRDISDRGVFVVAQRVPSTGAHVEIDAYLPSSDGNGGGVKLHGEGTVVRIEWHPGPMDGFAAAVTFQTESADESPVVSSRRLQ